MPFVELRITRPSENSEANVEAPWDGDTPGELEVRGPWVASHYYESPDQAHRWTEDGWFKTGDVASVDEDGDGENGGPREGSGEVRRRMDQFGRSGKCVDGSSGGEGSVRGRHSRIRNGRSDRWRRWC